MAAIAPGKEIRDVSKYFPIYFGEKLNKEEIMEMMGVEFERKIREIFAATEVSRQHSGKTEPGKFFGDSR